jgi:hypothetical protein
MSEGLLGDRFISAQRIHSSLQAKVGIRGQITIELRMKPREMRSAPEFSGSHLRLNAAALLMVSLLFAVGVFGVHADTS